MASRSGSYAVEREFAESMDDPFGAILELRAQLADAKRNEERTVAERLKDRERLTKVLRLDDSHGPVPASMDFILASIDAVVRQAAGPSARLMSEPMVQCEMAAKGVRIATLEVAVRAVRSEGLFARFGGVVLARLYALVPAKDGDA